MLIIIVKIHECTNFNHLFNFSLIHGLIIVICSIYLFLIWKLLTRHLILYQFIRDFRNNSKFIVWLLKIHYFFIEIDLPLVFNVLEIVVWVSIVNIQYIGWLYFLYCKDEASWHFLNLNDSEFTISHLGKTIRCVSKKSTLIAVFLSIYHYLLIS